MNIREAKEEIKHTLRVYLKKDEEGTYCYPEVRQRPILLMGPPGIGKTAIVQQVAAECGVGLVSYTLTHHTRQSAVGLPEIVERTFGGQMTKVTEYTMSEILASVYACMEQTGKGEGILFIDEINCVSETLAPTMLEFLQNKTFGNRKVPKGWVIVVAGNPPEYNKSVREFDIVTLDRVRQITIAPDLPAWLEYAFSRQMHGAVLSYLSVHPDDFYVALKKSGKTCFVTARGWEDLSELMKQYEEEGLPVGEEVIREFLQEDRIAREFAAYGRIYARCGRDYAVPELLEGTIVTGQKEEMICMAKRGSLEERFLVIGLFLEVLNRKAAEISEQEQELLTLRDALHLWEKRRKMEQKESLTDWIRERERAFHVREEAGLLSSHERKVEVRVLCDLRQMDVTLRELHQTETEEGLETLAGMLEKKKEQLEAASLRLEEMLSRAFSFVEECFGDGEEMVLFVTGLTRSAVVTQFIGERGCEPYFRFSEKLLHQKREEELREACRRELQKEREQNEL